MKRALLALVAALVALVAFAPAAGAHAALESSTPAAGDILDAAPREIELRFTEPVQVDGDSVRVFDATGTRLDTGEPETLDGGRAVVVPLPGLDLGGYVATWKVVSADGHPIGGGFTWRIGDGSEAVDAALVEALLEGQTAARAVDIAFGIVRFKVFASLLVLVGGAAFVSLIWPAANDRRRARRLLWWAWAVLLGSTLLGLGLQGADLGGLGLVDAFKPSVIGDVLDTTFGRVWMLRAALLLPVAWLLTQLRSARESWWRINAAVLGIALLATPAYSGHADSGRWLEVAKALDVTHLAAAAIWLGGLAVLLTAGLRSDVAEAREITERFSRLAFGAVVVVAVTGVGQSIRQVTTLNALEEPYGRLLAVKVVLVLALIGIASLTRSALHGRLTLDDIDDDLLPTGPGAMREGEVDEIGILRRLVAAEVAVALVVVAVTALLVNADPGYAVEASASPFDETQVVDASPGTGGARDVIINVVAVPGGVGPTDIHVYVDDPAGGLTPPVDATGTLALPGGGIAGIDVPFVTAGPSHWSANDVDIPIAGEWVVELEVLLTDVDRVTTTFTIPIGGAQ